MHNYKEAILAYRAGLEVDPSNGPMKEDLANAEEALKQEESAPVFVFAVCILIDFQPIRWVLWGACSTRISG